mgnify:CR=1 FL=1
MEKTDYYAILDVATDATEDEIKHSYRRLALRYHPDTNGGNTDSEDRFKAINEAYSILGDREKRRQYDALGHARFQGTVGYDDFLKSWYSMTRRGSEGNFQCRGRGMGRGMGRRGCRMRRKIFDE